MLIAIYGKSGVGKTTLLNYLDKNTKYKKIVSYTTRPIRNTEINGLDYHFVDTASFKNLKLRNITCYDSYNYGLPENALEDNDRACILDMHGIATLLRDYKHKLIVVKLSSDLKLSERSELRKEEDYKLFNSALADSLSTVSFNLINNSTLDNLYLEIEEYLKVWENL
jgi:guanylate kinase